MTYATWNLTAPLTHTNANYDCQIVENVRHGSGVKVTSGGAVYVFDAFYQAVQFVETGSFVFAS